MYKIAKHCYLKEKEHYKDEYYVMLVSYSTTVLYRVTWLIFPLLRNWLFGHIQESFENGLKRMDGMWIIYL